MTDSEITDAEIIQLLGGVTAVARMLDIKPPSVHGWLLEGIPESRLRELAAQIEIRADGRFTRRKRWPDKFAFYWPELATSENSTPDHSQALDTPAQAAIKPIAKAPAVESARGVSHHA